MSKIENIKTYSGQDLDNIFFRPMLTGKSAEELGIKVMYNMPVPTTLHFWKGNENILQKYTTGGWSGGKKSTKYQKTIDLHKVKAEMAYGADDYFSTVYELITGRADVNLDDLSGTELEAAETALFRSSIAEGIRSTMWYGDVERSSSCLHTFDGILKNIMDDANAGDIRTCAYLKSESEEWGEKVLRGVWDNAPEALKALRSEGQLAYFVSTDVYRAYEDQLDNVATESAYLAKQNGREGLYFRGIPVIDLQLNHCLPNVANLPHSFAILTDRRNVALAVNTNDFPGTEVRMWYNPDVMENRQRAVFMAGCDYLLPELLSVAVGMPFSAINVDYQNETVSISAHSNTNENWMDGFLAFVCTADGSVVVDDEYVENEDGRFYAEYQVGEVDAESLKLTACTLISKQGASFMML